MTANSRQMTRIGVAMLVGVALAACKQAADGGNGTATASAATPNAKQSNGGGCGGLPSADQLRTMLRQAPDSGEAGGMFRGKQEWAAVVNRNGEMCALAVSTDDPTAAWPGSQSIAKAKAYTANAFSTDTLATSTARLYTMAQPGHSLYGAAQANPFNPLCLHSDANGGDDDHGKVCGGTIVFGGGVPLYANGKKIGALGVSGDTPCTDHEIAKRIRDLAKLNPAKGKLADDIQYSKVDHGSVFSHPLCTNTWRNGQKVGDEPPASGY
jgi:uncharacterized protein GlcG (DUF336 family)